MKLKNKISQADWSYDATIKGNFYGKDPKIFGMVMILPLKIKDGTEAPVRLIGLIAG